MEYINTYCLLPEMVQSMFGISPLGAYQVKWNPNSNLDMADWLALPEEILVQILGYLSARDILSCATTCKQINAFVQASTHLQLIIELAVHGLRLRQYPGAESPHSRYRSAIEELDAFRRARKAWERLDPIKTMHIDTQISEYELSEATLGHGLRDEHEIFRGIELFQLYTEKGVDDCPVWKKYDDVGFNVQDFSFDHAEDLLVLVQAPPFHLSSDMKRVCLRTLSGNLAHPLAQKAVLESPGEEDWTQCEIRVCKSILAVHFSHPGDFSPYLGRLTIWNWKTGDVISTRTGVGGYCFLSHDMALIVGQQRWISENAVSDQNGPAVYRTEIQIIDMGNESVGAVRFEIPLSTSPSEVKVTAARPPTENHSDGKAYYTSPYIHEETAERVVVIEVSGERLFISGQRLLRLIDNPTSSAPSAAILDRYYRWPEWGPDTTFWLDSRYLVSSWVSVDGGRFAALSLCSRLFLTDLNGNVVSTRLNTASSQTGYSRLIILDFNQRPMKRDSARNQSSEAPRRTKAIEWRRKSPVFDREIVSRLPFRVFQGQAPGIAHELMVGMDHLVLTMGPGYDVLQFTD